MIATMLIVSEKRIAEYSNRFCEFMGGIDVTCATFNGLGAILSTNYDIYLFDLSCVKPTYVQDFKRSHPDSLIYGVNENNLTISEETSKTFKGLFGRLTYNECERIFTDRFSKDKSEEKK